MSTDGLETLERLDDGLERARTRARPSRPTLVRDFVAGDGFEARTFATRYQDRRLLGQGGMGLVRSCEDTSICREVAMKVMLRTREGSLSASAQFVREARIQGQLEHPSVVPVYDLGRDPEGRLYFTMKQVTGETLEDLLDGLGEQVVSQRRLLQSFVQICQAVDFAHQHKIVHRDLKPGNVMLGDYGEVYVLDWGLAAPFEESKASGIVGTPGYMSPEQTLGDELRASSDVWALGAILFEILCGEPLCREIEIEDVLTETRGGVEARPSVRTPEADVAPELEDIVVRATRRNVEDRIQTARELHDAVEGYLDGQRSAELRAALSVEHTERAQALSQDLDGQRQALRELGRAIVLDPDNARAVRALGALLTGNTAQTPPEVEDQLERDADVVRRNTGKTAAIAYATMLLYLPFFLWMGVSRWPSIAVFCGWALLAALSCLCVAYRRAPTSERSLLWALVASTAAFASLSSVFGSLVLLPGALTSNTVAYSIMLTGWRRTLAIVVGCLGIAVPFALELSGVLGPRYIFGDHGLTIVPWATELPAFASLTMLFAVSCSAILTAVIAVGGIRSDLRRAERRIQTYSWRIQQILPHGDAATMQSSGAVP